MNLIEELVVYFRTSKRRQILLLALVILLALAIRVLLYATPSNDLRDFEGVWYDTFIKYGRDTALGMDFYNYTPPTLYLIDLMTVFQFIPRDAALRLLCLPFDFLAAWGIYKILQAQFGKKALSWAGFCAFLFIPAVFIGSSMWGQPDMIYTAFLVWMFYFLLKEKPFPATLCFAIAFCFKFQALLAAPVLLILMMRRKYPVYWLLLVPAVYFVAVLPAWIAGRPLGELFTIYLNQYAQYSLPSANAANPYIFLNPIGNHDVVNVVGLGITAAAALFYLGMRWFKWKAVGPRALAYDFAVFTLLLPFLLPKMHDRYFLPSAVFLFILVFFDYRMIWAALLNQAAILLSYVPYFTHWSNEWVNVAALFNLAAVVWLVLQFKDNVGRSAEPLIQDMNAAHQ